MEAATFSQEPSTEKGRRRRERIIAVATQLFHRQGFHTTGIDEIGAAAGITGPGIYRHFSSKDEILIAVFDRIWMILRSGMDEAASQPPDAALDSLIERHVDIAVTHAAEMALLHRELRNLPAEYQARARDNRRAYEDAWAERIGLFRPGWTQEERRLVARCVFWMINSYAADPPRRPIAESRARELLESMARSVIGADADHTPPAPE